MLDPFHLNLRHLDAVTVIGQSGSISAAAIAVNLSQPALTQAVSSLERQIGFRLFDRQSSGLTPTKAGALFLPRIERAISYLVEGGGQVRKSVRLGPIAHVERRMTMTQLRALIAVESAGSYVLAARSVGLAQPSLHRAVRELELLMAVPLLVRVGRVMHPTNAARRFIRSARLAMIELRQGLEELSALEKKGAGRIVIGTLPLVRSILMPRTLARFISLNPTALVQIVEGTYPVLLHNLMDGDIDLLIGALRVPPPTDDVVQTPLFASGLYIVARAGHPLAHVDNPSMEQLLSFPWVIAPQGTPTRQKWEEMFVSAGKELPALNVECTSSLIIRGLLLEGEWLSLLSPDQFLLEVAQGLLVRIGRMLPESEREIGVTTRADWYPTALQADFMETLRVCSRIETS